MEYGEHKIGVVIVAGGNGRRMSQTTATAQPKQFMFLGNEPILARTINTFAAALPNAEIVIVLPTDYIEFWHNLAARFTVAKHTATAGGQERFHSVKNGIDSLSADVDIIAVQDGVRPLVSTELIDRCIECAIGNGSAIPVVEPADSFRQIDSTSSRIIDRKSLRAIQTPQVFAAELLRKAYKCDYRTEFTDDASVVEYAGGRVTLTDGETQNIKITTAADLLFAQAIVDSREEEE